MKEMTMMQSKKIPLTLAISAMLLVCVAAAQGPRRRAVMTNQPAQTLTLAAGTPIEVRLANQVHTGENRDGDTFQGTLAKPLVVAGRTMIAKDARATGRMVNVVSSGRLKRPASVTLELVEVGGYALRTQPVTLDGKSHAGRNAALIGGGAAAGAIIGAIAGGGKGAAIGAAAGAGAGTATAYMTGKKELVLPPEFVIGFVTAGNQQVQTAGGYEDRVPVQQPSSDPRTQPYPGVQQPSTDPRPRPYPTGQQERVYMFTDSDRAIIGDYMRINRANLPPGLAKRDRLPPGLERQLQRNGTLPPGLQKRVQPFPQDLTRRLPPLPGGASRAFLGNRAMILDQSLRILDMYFVE